MAHPDGELIAYLRGELGPPERERVDAHLAACVECREDLDAFPRLLDTLRAGLPEPPAIHWGSFRAELREKVAARAPLTHRARLARWWPVPAVLSAAVASLLVFLAVHGVNRAPRPGETFTAFEEVAIGGQLDLLKHYQVVERLDLLEDLDVIRNLDSLEAGRAS